MYVVWSRKKLLNILYDFHLISGIRVGFFDVDGREIMAYPTEHSKFCSKIRYSAEAKEECLKCDNIAYQHAQRSSEPYLYHCHAGMTEMVVPVKEHGKLLGFLMVGQVKTEQSEKLEDNVIVHLKRMHLDVNALKKIFYECVVVDVRMLEAYARILEACAAYVLSEKYIRLQDEPLALTVNKFICEHLSDPLDIPMLCNGFAIGKTTLCKEIKSEYNLTVTELIRLRRVEASQKLLQKNNLTIAEIAEFVGISDYNYFTKVFKKQTGVTPSTYRKLCRLEALELMHHNN